MRSGVFYGVLSLQLEPLSVILMFLQKFIASCYIFKTALSLSACFVLNTPRNKPAHLYGIRNPKQGVKFDAK
jgi:hypothetical protein